MIDDQYDYYQYSLRKFTLKAFEGLMTVINNELYRYKHVVKIAIGVCKLALKVEKIKEEELAKFTPLFEEYKSSEEYRKLQTETTPADEDEEYKKDTDPKGFQKYHDLLLGKADFSKFVECCTRLNPDCADL